MPVPTRGSTSAGPFDPWQPHRRAAQLLRALHDSYAAIPRIPGGLSLPLGGGVFPFLRAHEPNLPGRCPIWTFGRRIVKKSLCPPGSNSTTGQEREPIVLQLTNRRVRKFFTTPRDWYVSTTGKSTVTL